MKLEITCPSCSKRGKIEIDENLIKMSARGISAVNIPEGNICSHSFIAYLDKNFAVRDCFLTDFTIELPQLLETQQKVSETEMLEETSIDVNLIKIVVNALSLAHILRACFVKKSAVYLLESDEVTNHLKNLLLFIFKNSFGIELYIKNLDQYRKEKKQFKESIVFDSQNIINDKSKVLEAKHLKIESTIVQKFLAEDNQKVSLVVLKNEVQKAYELSKDIVHYLETRDKSEKLVPKLINNYLFEKHHQSINDPYLRFLISIVQNYFNVEFTSMFEFADYVKWSYFLK